MSLGQEISPHLPFLRRYARALTGSQARGDAIVRATLEAIIAAPDSFPRNIDPRLGLYQTFQGIWSSDPRQKRESGRSGRAEGIALGRLSQIAPLARQALLLTAMEGFAPEDAGYLIGVSGDEIDRMVSEALAEIERQTRADVLIIEDEPIIAKDIEMIVRDLGHNVIGVAVTRDEAVSQALARRPGLVLADIQLADDSSGIDAVRDILAEFSVPVIFITAFPERFLTGVRPEPALLITKPFQRSTLRSAIAQALFLGAEPSREEKKAPPVPPSAKRPDPIARELVEPRPGPVSVRVLANQLRLAEATPVNAALSNSSLEAVRRIHLDTAKRLGAALQGSNVGPGFSARFEAVRKILMRRLTQERGLQLAIQVRGLEAMMPAVSERLDDVTGADIGVFVEDLLDVLRLLPGYRTFIEQAREIEPVSGEGQRAAIELAVLLEQQPDELVHPELKDAVADIRETAENRPDGFTMLSLARTVGNAFRAIGRFFNRRIAKTATKATEAFDDTFGKTLGKSFALLVAGSATVGLLTLMAQLFRSEFAFVSELIRAARGLLG